MILHMTFQEMLEHSDQRESKLYKWVRVGEEFRFVHLIFQENHAMAVEEGEEGDSAGTISANSNFWRVVDWGSTTLKIGCSQEAAETLEKNMLAAGRSERE